MQSYFDQAADIARLLDIKLTSRKFDGRRVHMCGFPLTHLDKHLKILVQQNKLFVAMCEEFRRPTVSSVKEFDRRVARVITPGTLIDESFLNPYDNNYLLSVSLLEAGASADSSRPVGLAWVDVSTGEFFAKVASLDTFRDELVRINPREVVLARDLSEDASHPLRRALANEECFVSYALPDKQEDLAAGPIELIDEDSLLPSDVITAGELAAISSRAGDATMSLHETAAIKLLTSYLRFSLMEHMPTLPVPNRDGVDGRMRIDHHTLKALEIREGSGEGIKGSLLSVVKRTLTNSGTRLLSRWLCKLLISFRFVIIASEYIRFTEHLDNGNQCATITCGVFS